MSDAEFTMEPTTDEPFDINHPCANHTVIDSNYDRSINYFLQPEDATVCESSNVTAGWYRFQNYQNIPTVPPYLGQCGSLSPIWLNGNVKLKLTIVLLVLI